MKVTQVQFKNIEQPGIKGSRIASRSYLQQFQLICLCVEAEQRAHAWGGSDIQHGSSEWALQKEI